MTNPLTPNLYRNGSGDYNGNHYNNNIFDMEVDPKIKELSEMLKSERDADKVKSDLANSDAFKNGTAHPIPEKLKDKQNVINAPKLDEPKPSPLLAELAKQTKETREFGELKPI